MRAASGASILLSTIGLLFAQPIHAVDVRDYPDMLFAKESGRELRMDISVPQMDAPPPLVVFLHGGGWESGTRKDHRLRSLDLPKNGFAVASIDYRFSSDAIFPAQIHDCKGAIRWLRAHADEYGYEASRIAVIGTSAGGHLAALLGTSGGLKELEGTVGGNPKQPSSVQAVVDFYGATDFLLRSQTQPEMTETPESLVYKLLGGSVSEKRDLAILASSVSHVSADDPPLLVIHGDADLQVLPDQARRIADVYRKQGLDVELIIVPNGTHTSDALYFEGDVKKAVIAFLTKQLLRP